MYDDPRILDLLSLIYPHTVNQWVYCRQGRNMILTAGLGKPTDMNALPRTNERAIRWQFEGFNFELAPFVKNAPQGKARFFVECPSCGKWCSVGKYMLHAKVHKLTTVETRD